ncbi:MAG: ribonuclease J [Acidobacteriota bacterium]|nr:ribonuclease J [Acidobacteriota bacterium]
MSPTNPTDRQLQIVPLGGVAEFGKNTMVYRCGDDAIIVDAGMMFPGDELPGVDTVVPDLKYLTQCPRIHGLILTHGHEDHVGGVPHLLRQHPTIPIYATDHVREILRIRLQEHGDIRDVDLRPLPLADDRVDLGPFGVQSLAVAHSIPCTRAIALHTPLGPIIHTADFKFDDAPIDGVRTEIERFREFGDAGVLALMIDSTNADRLGSTPGEHVALEGLRSVVGSADGRVFVTLFSSNIHRIQGLVDVARECGRRVAVVGASLIRHVDIAERLGLIRIPDGLRIAPRKAMGIPCRKLLVVVTGSQGEPTSALSRIAFDRHRDFYIESGDLLVHSARKIPGNEKRIERVFNELTRIGVDIVTADDAAVHVSGHPAADDIHRMLEATRPAFVVPVHGEQRQLRANRDLAVSFGQDPDRVPLMSCGERLVLDWDAWTLHEDVPVGDQWVDSLGEIVSYDAIRERRQVGADGVVAVAWTQDTLRRRIEGDPVLSARGFAPPFQPGDTLYRGAQDTVIESVVTAPPEAWLDPDRMAEHVHGDLRRFLRRRTRRRPLIVPLLLK